MIYFNHLPTTTTLRPFRAPDVLGLTAICLVHATWMTVRGAAANCLIIFFQKKLQPFQDAGLHFNK